MFLDLDNETSFSVGLRAKIDAFLMLFLTVQFLYTSQLLFSSYSKWKKLSNMIIIIKISSLILLCLGLDNARCLKVCLETRGLIETIRWLKADRLSGHLSLVSTVMSHRHLTSTPVFIKTLMLASLMAGHPMALAVVMVFQSPLDYFCNPSDYYFYCFPGICPLPSLLCWDFCDGWSSLNPPPVLCSRSQSYLLWKGATRRKLEGWINTVST